MAYFLKAIIFFMLATLLNAQLYNGWNFGRYYATAPGNVALARPPALAIPVPVARPVVAAPAVPVVAAPVVRPVVAAPAVPVVGAPVVGAPVVVPGYAPFASSAIIYGSNKGGKKN
uniref:Neuropeptide-like 4 n=1 Tax=Strongyloides stercoralis TaxID=6248 RepID=A0A0K0E118_STRER